MGMSQSVKEYCELERLLRAVQALFGLARTANVVSDAQDARARVERLHRVVKPVLEDEETMRLVQMYAGSGR